MEAISTLIVEHRWAALCALLAGVLVRLSKSDNLVPLNIPARLRPWIPVVFGVFGAVAEALANGKPWSQAIVAGIFVALAPIAGHELLVESLRGGKELPVPGLMKDDSKGPKDPPARPPTVIVSGLLLGLVVALVGCTPARSPERDIVLGSALVLVVGAEGADEACARVASTGLSSTDVTYVRRMQTLAKTCADAKDVVVEAAKAARAAVKAWSAGGSVDQVACAGARGVEALARIGNALEAAGVAIPDVVVDAKRRASFLASLGGSSCTGPAR
jgi:hypothetical protein